jgi:hypothetical protein
MWITKIKYSNINESYQLQKRQLKTAEMYFTITTASPHPKKKPKKTDV